MIIPLKSGAQLVIGECPWVPAVYLSVGNVRGSQGAMVDCEALDVAIAELSRIRGLLAERQQATQRKRQKAA
jgi:hypothetical protein